ncbi:hypothetical protein J4G02_19750, partial [Candidatus Poribacteria bacterium]|nr:hypothetical protein [Candidatus Poribacteria bacterium]
RHYAGEARHVLLTGRIPLLPQLFGVAAFGLPESQQLHRLVERVGRSAGSADRNTGSVKREKPFVH